MLNGYGSYLRTKIAPILTLIISSTLLVLITLYMFIHGWNAAYDGTLDGTKEIIWNLATVVIGLFTLVLIFGTAYYFEYLKDRFKKRIKKLER